MLSSAWLCCGYNFITIVSKLHSDEKSYCIDYIVSVRDGMAVAMIIVVPCNWYQIFVTPDAANRYSFVTICHPQYSLSMHTIVSVYYLLKFVYHVQYYSCSGTCTWFTSASVFKIPFFFPSSN